MTTVCPLLDWRRPAKRAALTGYDVVRDAQGAAAQLDRLRAGRLMASSRSMRLALMRLQTVRELGIRVPAATRIPATRIAALARFAGAAKVIVILRLPELRRLATLVPVTPQ